MEIAGANLPPGEDELLGPFLPVDGGYVLPHVAGLCRPHHDDVEQHRAWIKLEDGNFTWYERVTGGTHDISEVALDKDLGAWKRLGPLNPQPGSREGRPKRKKFKGEKRRKRATISTKVPKDEQENGAEVWDDLFGNGKDEVPYGRVRQKLDRMGMDGSRPAYNVIVDAANDWLNDA